MRFCRQLVFGLVAAVATAAALAPVPYSQFCIIGGGPGVIQLGRYMQTLGMDYVVLERGPTPAQFFQKYPIHRGHISINKVHAGNTDPEFTLRHAWNSMLVSALPTDPSTWSLFTNYS